MRKDNQSGHFLDQDGKLQPDRRSGVDRRLVSGAETHELRRIYRRKADRELYERDHKPMIKEALEDFAEEHDGHL